MEQLLTQQWHKRAIPGSRHDDDINVISNYIPLAFSDEYGSTGLITRIIELAGLREMRPLFDLFEDNTGYRVGDSDCTERELDVITHRAIALHEKIHSRLNGMKVNLSQCEAELAMIKSGGAGSSGDIVREKAYYANENKERLTRSIAKTESWCDFIACILLLLNHELNAWEKGDYKRKCELPKITASGASKHYLQSMSKEAHLLLGKLGKLESAINNINSRFKLPTDRYEKRRPTVLLNIEACKFYYSKEGELTRNTMSCADYILSVINPMESAILRYQEMKSEFNFSQ